MHFSIASRRASEGARGRLRGEKKGGLPCQAIHCMKHYKILSSGVANSTIHPALSSVLSYDGWHAVTYAMKVSSRGCARVLCRHEYFDMQHVNSDSVYYVVDARLWDPCELPHKSLRVRGRQSPHRAARSQHRSKQPAHY